MKVPDIYHNRRVVLGIALILLGAGNWLVGRLRTEQYSKLVNSEHSAGVDQAIAASTNSTPARSRCSNRSPASSGGCPTQPPEWIFTTRPFLPAMFWCWPACALRFWAS